MRKCRVLGLSIGTRRIGVAVVERNSIFDCQMKSFKGVWSERKLRSILATIEEYIAAYRICHMAIKLPPTYSHSDGIAHLLRQIRGLAKSNRCTFHTYTISQLKKAWGEAAQNKRHLMLQVLEKYNLVQLYNREIKNRNKYYEKVFEAVGVADMVLQEI